MAGGPNAETVTCLLCEEMSDGVCQEEAALKMTAVRVYEGSETDQYQCERGHLFGLDWRGREAGHDDKHSVRQ